MSILGLSKPRCMTFNMTSISKVGSDLELYYEDTDPDNTSSGSTTFIKT